MKNALFITVSVIMLVVAWKMMRELEFAQGRATIQFIATTIGQNANCNAYTTSTITLPDGSTIRNDLTIPDTGSPLFVSSKNDGCQRVEGEEESMFYGLGLELKGVKTKADIRFEGGLTLNDFPIMCIRKAIPCSEEKCQKYHDTPILGVGSWYGGIKNGGFSSNVGDVPRTFFFGDTALHYTGQKQVIEGWIDVGTRKPMSRLPDVKLIATDTLSWRVLSNVTIVLVNGNGEVLDGLSAEPLFDTGTSAPMHVRVPSNTVAQMRTIDASGMYFIVGGKQTRTAMMPVHFDMPKGFVSGAHTIVGMPVLQALFEGMEFHSNVLKLWFRK